MAIAVTTTWPLYGNDVLGDCQEAALANCIFVKTGIRIPYSAVLAAYNHWLRKLTEHVAANNGYIVFKFVGIGGIKPTKYIPVTLTRLGFESALAQYKAVSVCMPGHQVMVYQPTESGVTYVSAGQEFPWTWDELLKNATDKFFVGRTFTFEV